MSHISYACGMTEVPSRELRNNTRVLLERVAAGEPVTITVDGRPVAELSPPRAATRWMQRDRFFTEILAKRADPGMRDDLRDLAGDLTGDLDNGERGSGGETGSTAGAGTA